MVALKGPIHVHWELTNLCNYNCLHCYQQADPDLVVLDTKQYAHIAKKLVQAEVFEVTITGGEPFLIESSFSIVDILLSGQISTYITSNGSLITNDIAKGLFKRSIPIQISLDSHNPCTHDLIRQHSGSFQDVLRTLDILNTYNCNLSLAFCVNKYNLSDLEGVINLAIETGIKKLIIGEVIDFGRMKHPEIILNSTQYSTFAIYSADLKEKYADKIFISINLDRGFIFDSRIAHAPCSATDRDIAILYNGDVSPCPFIRYDQYRLGSILVQTMPDIWKSPKTVEFRSKKHLGCSKDCEYYPVCKSGCKCILANLNMPIEDPDPRCILNQRT